MTVAVSYDVFINLLGILISRGGSTPNGKASRFVLRGIIIDVSIPAVVVDGYTLDPSGRPNGGFEEVSVIGCLKKIIEDPDGPII